MRIVPATPQARLCLGAFDSFATRIAPFKKFVTPLNLRYRELCSLKSTVVTSSSQDSSKVHSGTIPVEPNELRSAPAEWVFARDQRVTKAGEDGTAKGPKFVPSCNLMICDNSIPGTKNDCKCGNIKQRNRVSKRKGRGISHP
jgi:hypothetical protein